MTILARAGLDIWVLKFEGLYRIAVFLEDKARYTGRCPGGPIKRMSGV